MRGRMALLLGVAMLPAGAIAMQLGFNAISARQAAYEDTLASRTMETIAPERAIVDQVRQILRVLAASPDFQRARAGDCRAWLGGVAEEYNFVASIAGSSEDGRVLCSVPQAPPNFRAQPTEIRRIATARDAFTMAYVEHGRLAGVPVIAAMQPLKDDGNRRVGFVGVSMRASLFKGMLDASQAESGARLAIVDSAGRVILASSSPSSATDPPLPTPRQFAERRRDPRSGVAYAAVEGGDAVIAPLSDPDLFMVTSWPQSQPYWQRMGGYAVSIAAPLLIWILAVAAGWFAIEIYVARPLSMLEGAARGFARGDEVSEPDGLATAPEEIRSLRRTMAAMAKTLRGREGRLIEALAEERALLREVHHRVKNNLQMVASLLSIQARAAGDDSEARGLSRAHDRVQLLALVHQRIYASGELRDLRLDDLMAEIARQLIQARGAAGQKITLRLELGVARADTDRAVPLAFLFGEGVSSALDCIGEAGGELKVLLQQDEDGALRFAMDVDAEGPVADSGISARLIDAFARQLGAQLGRSPPCRLWISIPPRVESA